jgi:hypothetical protein
MAAVEVIEIKGDASKRRRILRSKPSKAAKPSTMV